jgi:hypothetical protein
MHVCERKPDPGHLKCLAVVGFDTASAAARILFRISLPAATVIGLLFGFNLPTSFGCISPFTSSSPVKH